MLYWRKRTNTDLDELLPNLDEQKSIASALKALLRFTCFTGTKVQILTQLLTNPDEQKNIAAALQALMAHNKKLQESVQVRYSVYFLYWYKSTNTDAAAAGVAKQSYGSKCAREPSGARSAGAGESQDHRHAAIYILGPCVLILLCVLILIVGEEEEYRHGQRVC